MASVQLLFFGRFREIFSAEQLESASGFSMALTEAVTVYDIIALLKSNYPDLALDPLTQKNCLYSINHELCELNAMVKPGDELAFMPPVTGG